MVWRFFVPDPENLYPIIRRVIISDRHSQDDRHDHYRVMLERAGYTNAYYNNFHHCGQVVFNPFLKWIEFLMKC